MKNFNYGFNGLSRECRYRYFQNLKNYIKPKPKDLSWTSIPWEADLWEARKKAEKYNRPMFMWAMNGNPLGSVCGNGIENRFSVFSNKEIIQFLTNYFIPVVENSSLLERQSDLKGDFFRFVTEQGHFGGRTLPTATRQGLYICTHEGNLLASTNLQSADLVLEMIEKAMLSWSNQKSLRKHVVVPEDYQRDARFYWEFPHDGLILKIYIRDLPSETCQTYNRYNLDYAWFTKEEMTKFIPDNLQVGNSYSIPSRFVHRIARFHLVDTVRGESPPWHEKDIKQAQMSAFVESVTENQINLCLEGLISNASPPSFETNPFNNKMVDMERGLNLGLLGYLIYNTRSKAFERFDMIAVGSRWGATTYNFRFDDLGPAPIGLAFELASNSIFDRTPPQAFFYLITSYMNETSKIQTGENSSPIQRYFL